MKQEQKLLSRDDFRNGVFERDNHQCVICKKPAVDAHHIVERRLFDDGGYYLDNGSSLCSEHHLEAEMTTLGCDTIRKACEIEKIVLPEHLYVDQEYDKWGNPIIKYGAQRLKGELFYDESVQKILNEGNVLHLFSPYVKYPRSHFVPWGEKVTKDDKQLQNDDSFIGKKVVVTLKMDGENTTMYKDHIHARSIDSGTHPTRNKVKEIWSMFAYQLSLDERVCGENLYAKHSIEYNDLESYFMVFSWWEGNKCLSWEETVFNAKACDLEIVPTIYEGIYDKDTIHKLYESKYKGNNCEGYVIRLADEFTYGEFKNSLMKYVDPVFREKINNSHGHWISKKIEPNKLKA